VDNVSRILLPTAEKIAKQPSRLTATVIIKIKNKITIPKILRNLSENSLFIFINLHFMDYKNFNSLL
jgi:hypothetical protein